MFNLAGPRDRYRGWGREKTSPKMGNAAGSGVLLPGRDVPIAILISGPQTWSIALPNKPQIL